MTLSEIEVFSDVCGATAPLCLEIAGEDGAPGIRHAFDQPFVVIGRAPGADLVLDGVQVSRRHCYLQLIEGRVLCIDLGSPAGILVGGRPLRVAWIDRAEPLQVGSVPLWLRGGNRHRAPGTGSSGPQAPRPLGEGGARENALPPTDLEIAGTNHQFRRWRIRRAVTLIGSAPGCRVRLLDPGISPYHGALVRTPAGVWLVDLGSRGGLWVAGARVRVARLDFGIGSGCRLGPFQLRGQSLPLEQDASTTPIPAPLLQVASAPRQESTARHSRSSGPFQEGPAPPAPSPAPAPYDSGPAANVPAVRTADDRATTARPAAHPAITALADMLLNLPIDQLALVRGAMTEIRRLSRETPPQRAELMPQPREPSGLPTALARSIWADSWAGSAASFLARESAGMTPPDRAGRIGATDEDRDHVWFRAPDRRDPQECLAIAREFLLEYHREQQGSWVRMLRMVSALSRGQVLRPDPRRSPRGTARRQGTS